MEKAQKREWADAQKIAVSINLLEAAKELLKFLAVVDRNRFLYEDHALQRAIYRYNVFWLPLLAKHSDNLVSEKPLVVPLDCEWIWHCHRLNPVTYRFDCEKLFGRILGNHKVISSVQATSKNTTVEIWNKMYPEEPYELDLSRPFSEDVLQKSSLSENFSSYDLLAAVKRQIPFTFQVSRPHMSSDQFLREAVARYKGFLHLIRKNRLMKINRFCVPTYDVDLMWHTHQLHPDSYCKDMIESVGFVVQHDDDTESHQTKGGKLDVGFSETSRQWEQIFGLSYRKAGAMSRGNMPTPVTQLPVKFNILGNEFNELAKCGKQIKAPVVKAMEVLLEFVDAKNLPGLHKDNLLVAFSKKQPDKFFNTKRLLSISSSNSKENLFSLFRCEPTGEFLFELMSYSPTPKSLKLLGSCSLSLEKLLASGSQLSTQKWVAVDLVSGLGNSESFLQISISFTPPTPTLQVFQLVQSKPSEDGTKQTHIMYCDGKKVFSLGTRNTVKDTITSALAFGKEVYCITDSGKEHTLLDFNGNGWVIKGNHGSLKLQDNSGDDDSLLRLVGYKMVKLFPGRRLDFEPKHFISEKSEQDFVTAVEFSKDYPYGRAVALIDTKLETIKAIDEWIVIPGITLAFILSDIQRGEGRRGDDFTTEGCKKANFDNADEDMVIMNGGGYGSLCISQCGYMDNLTTANQLRGGEPKNGGVRNHEQGILGVFCGGWCQV